MNLDQAKQFSAALYAAIKNAEAAGKTEVDLIAQLQAMDDAARDALVQAIAQAGN